MLAEVNQRRQTAFVCFVLVATSVTTNLLPWLVWMNFCSAHRMNVTTWAKEAEWLNVNERSHTCKMSTNLTVLKTLRVCRHLLESRLTLPAPPVVQEKEVSCTNKWGIQRLNVAPFSVIQPKLSLRKPQ